jgi:rhomboid protease GluP
VFVALGVLSAYSWQTRFRFPQRWAARWGPLIAGVLLLAWTGSGGESAEGQGIDVVAHALGFAVGVLMGVLVAGRAVGNALGRLPQWLTGVLALTPVVVSWALALSS